MLVLFCTAQFYVFNHLEYWTGEWILKYTNMRALPTFYTCICSALTFPCEHWLLMIFAPLFICWTIIFLAPLLCIFYYFMDKFTFHDLLVTFKLLLFGWIIPKN
jgi:hypothetical protein